jgi:hypothetical protein
MARLKPEPAAKPRGVTWSDADRMADRFDADAVVPEPGEGLLKTGHRLSP